MTIRYRYWYRRTALLEPVLLPSRYQEWPR